MAEWPSTLPPPQKRISLTPGDTRKTRDTVSGRKEIRRMGSGAPDQIRVLFRLTSAQWTIFKHLHEWDFNLGLNWFTASWLSTLGYTAHKARFLGYPREVARQQYYVDVVATLLVQATADIVGEDTLWPCAATGAEPPPPETFGYIFGGKLGVVGIIQDCDQYNATLNAWASKTNVPNPARWGMSVSTIDVSAYIYGGITTSFVQDCDKYTPDTWASATNLPAPGRGNSAASTIGDSAYVYAGYGSYFPWDCDKYTPNVWSAITNIPNPRRYYLAASTIGDSSYIYAGFSSWGGGYIQDCDEYTPNTWTAKANMPAPARACVAASTIGDSAYVYAGWLSPNSLQDCDEYTPDTWTAKANMPAPARSYLAASTI